MTAKERADLKIELVNARCTLKSIEDLLETERKRLDDIESMIDRIDPEGKQNPCSYKTTRSLMRILPVSEWSGVEHICGKIDKSLVYAEDLSNSNAMVRIVESHCKLLLQDTRYPGEEFAMHLFNDEKGTVTVCTPNSLNESFDQLVGTIRQAAQYACMLSYECVRDITRYTLKSVAEANEYLKFTEGAQPYTICFTIILKNIGRDNVLFSKESFEEAMKGGALYHKVKSRQRDIKVRVGSIYNNDLICINLTTKHYIEDKYLMFNGSISAISPDKDACKDIVMKYINEILIPSLDNEVIDLDEVADDIKKTFGGELVE